MASTTIFTGQGPGPREREVSGGSAAVVGAHAGAALDGAVPPVPARHTEARPVLTLAMQLASAAESDIMRSW